MLRRILRAWALTVGLGLVVVGSASASSWRLIPMAGGGFTSMNSVSCSAPGACTAVGADAGAYPAAERWNGTSWRIEPTPSEPMFSQLLDVSCPTSRFCVAVGASRNQMLAERWNGISWSVTPIRGREVASLSGVSCVNATFCLAVGYEWTDLGSQVPVGAVWNGTAWKLTPPDTPYYGLFERVSCVTSTSCVAVGTVALMARWNGTGWGPNLPAPEYSQSVSCVPGGFCAVGGGYDNGNANGTNPQAIWFGNGEGNRTFGPDYGPFLGGLPGMSCLGARDCVAVGTLSTGAAIAASWNGTAWSVQQLPEGASDVSCSRGVCMAVGGLMSEQN